MPEVSVIIPNYNHAAFLKERIDSVLQQTYRDFEIIILDDCSTDSSRDVLESYRSDPKISQIIYNEANSGNTFKQWEKGIALAKGNYIWIAESDDWCEVSLLKTLMDAFEQDPGLVLGYVQSIYLLENNRIKWIPQKEALEQTVPGAEFTRKYMLHGNDVFNASMAVFKKTAYENLPGRYTGFRLCGDWLFWSDIARKGKVFISGKLLNYFRNHNGDVSRKVYANGQNFVEELQVLFSFYDDRLISEDDFFAELNIKHHRYKKVEKSLAAEMNDKIAALFYDDIHTKPFRSRLVTIYERGIRRQKINRVKQKLKNVFKFRGS